MTQPPRDVVSVSTSWSRDAPTSRLGLVSTKIYKISVSSRGADASVSVICVSCPRHYFAQILRATLVKWAKWAVAIMAVLTQKRIGQCITYWQKFRVIIINGRENKVTTVIIITCRPTPIVMSRLHLVTYKRLVSKFERLSRSRLGL